MSLIGIIPARMGAYRFPGKPLHPILGKPMLQHVWEAANQFESWEKLVVATCDLDIKAFCHSMNYPCVMTRPDHPRAMDRVAEAADIVGASNDDVIVNVQGDEPMLSPDMIRAVVDPIVKYGKMATLLAIPIHDEELYRSPDIVKVVSDDEGNVMYTSRSPIPYFDINNFVVGEAKRIGGIFGFRKIMLNTFMHTPQHPLEIAEACDSNRLCGNGMAQFCVIIPYRPYFSVDRIEDVARVEEALRGDR